MICVSIGRTRHKMVAHEHRELAEAGAELVELRLDWLSHLPDLDRLLEDRPTPVVITCRRRSDKGHWNGSEESRQTILRSAIAAGVEYIDIEEDIATQVSRYGDTQRIISYHNFDETPDSLEETHARMCQLDADIIKIVTMANSPADSIRLLKLVQGSPIPTIGFCMGELGVLSRILCGKYGSPFTYATFSSERELAPGQLSFNDMVSLYRYDQIDAETRLYGVLGDPIAHSLSPLIHNAALAHEQLNAVYLPLRVPLDRLGETLEAFEWLGIDGYSVTIPHKEQVLDRPVEPDEAVSSIGAANTLHRNASGTWHATNTDLPAALDALRASLKPQPGVDPLVGKKVLVLGAGGAARAIGAGLVRAGAVVTICGRTRQRAGVLAEELGCQNLAWENRGSPFIDILVNCTPVGMHPDVDESPTQPQWIRGGSLVFDTVYNPENTLLIKQARERGCQVVTGIEMFVGQAALQFEQFTDRPAPVELMKRTLRHGISAVR